MGGLVLQCLLYGHVTRASPAQPAHRELFHSVPYTTGCNNQIEAVSIPAVRRSGTSGNGWAAHPSIGDTDYVSDSNLEMITLIRTQPAGFTHELSDAETQAGTFGDQPSCPGGFTVTQDCRPLQFSPSNATQSQANKRNNLEVGDVVSFDVTVKNQASGSFLFPPILSEIRAPGRRLTGANPGTEEADSLAPAQIAVKLGCADSACDQWAGVGNTNMFGGISGDTFKFIKTESSCYVTADQGTCAISGYPDLNDPSSNYQGLGSELCCDDYSDVTAYLDPNPSCADDSITSCADEGVQRTDELAYEEQTITGSAHTYVYDGTDPPYGFQWGCCQPHAVLSFTRRLPNFPHGVPINGQGKYEQGNVLGVVLAEVLVDVDTNLLQTQVSTKTTTNAVHLTDQHCDFAADARVTGEGISNLKPMRYNPPPPPKIPPSEPPEAPPLPSQPPAPPPPSPKISPPTGCRRDDDSDEGDGSPGSGNSGDGSSDSDCSDSSDGDGQGSGSDSEDGDGDGSGSDEDSDSDNDEDDAGGSDGEGSGSSDGTGDTDSDSSSDTDGDDGDDGDGEGSGSDSSDSGSDSSDSGDSSGGAGSGSDSGDGDSSDSGASADSDDAASATDAGSTDNGSTADTSADNTDGATGDSAASADNSGDSDASSGASIDDSEPSSEGA